MFIAVQNGVAQLLALGVMCVYMCVWGEGGPENLPEGMKVGGSGPG